MITLIKDLIAILAVVYILSQIVFPCFLPNLEFFNLHKKKKQPIQKPTSTLEDLDEKATKASEKIKEVKSEVEITEKKVNEIKNKLNN